MPAPAEVNRIASLADPVIRNLRITQCYHELSLAMRALTPDSADANWCTFAASASKQAGQTIRHEDPQDHIRERLERSEKIPAIVRQIVDAFTSERGELFSIVNQVVAELGPLERSGNEVAIGNRRVFEEVGLLFARFVEAFPSGAPRDDTKMQAFSDLLRTGEPPDGQNLLKKAFRAYYEAIFSPPGKVRSELMLLANLLVGMHEQLRLQPQIKGALDGALVTPEDVEKLLFGRLMAKRGLVARLLDLTFPSRTAALRALVRLLANEVRDVVRIVVTEHLMTLTLPGNRVLRLARDVPGKFPPNLESIQNLDLIGVLKQVDPTANSTASSGAMDWAHFTERIHYIADLFRVFQEDSTLFNPPFTAEQVTILKAGRRPDGPL